MLRSTGQRAQPSPIQDLRVETSANAQSDTEPKPVLRLIMLIFEIAIAIVKFLKKSAQAEDKA